MNIDERPASGAVTWRERAYEWAEETVEGGASGVILQETAEAVAQTLLALREQHSKSYCSECEGTGAVTVATAQCCGRPGDECGGMPIPVPAPEPCPACHGGELLTPPTNRQFNFALGLLDSARQEITPIIGETASLCSAIDDFLRTGEVPSNCEEQASRSEPHKPGGEKVVAFGAQHCGDPLCELCCPDDLIVPPSEGG